MDGERDREAAQMNIEQRLAKLEKQFIPESCGHILVRYGDDGSGQGRPPEPVEREPCCAIARPIVLRVVYEDPAKRNETE